MLDARSVGGRQFKSLSYLLPYVNAIGSGLDLIPEVGTTCMVLAGHKAGSLQMVIGFKVAMADGGNGVELGKRIEGLPEGSMAMRAVGEDGSDARVICYRGGTVLVGSGSNAVTLYTPLGAIHHLFDNWEMVGPGGSVKWTRDDGSPQVEYHAEYRHQVDPAKPGFRVNVDIGAKGDFPVSVKVTRSRDDQHPALEVYVDDDGVAHFKGNIMEFDAYATMRFKAPNMTFNGRRLKPGSGPV